MLVPITGWQPVLNLVLKQHSHVLFLSFKESLIHAMFNMQLIYVIIEYIYKSCKKKLVVEKWSVLNNLLVPSYFFIQFCEKEKLKVSEMWHVMCYVKGRWKVMSFGKHIV